MTLVLLATGVLTAVPPPQRAVGQDGGLSSRLEVEGVRIALLVSPGQVGVNRFLVTLADGDGRPLPAERVLLGFDYQEQDLGGSTASTTAGAPGRFEAVGGFVGLPGTWNVRVAVGRTAGPDAEAVFKLSVPDAGRPGLIPAPTGAAVDAGRRLYGQLCARCHGITGFGDGPDGVGLKPPPLNLNAHVPFHGDQQLYRFIADGLPGTAMVPWKNTLREDEIWALVHYLRATFKEQEQ